MLYKKIHRQYIREFKKGRKFKHCDEIVTKLYIVNGCIWVKRSDGCDINLIPLHSPFKGIIGHKDLINWLE